MTLEGSRCFLFNLELETCRKPNRAKESEMVLFETVVWIANSSDDLFFQILLAADVVDHLVLDRVEKQPVDGEIATLGVLLGGREMHFRWTTSVEVNVVA